MTTDKSVSVAFCCLGNICRSPMAEAVFKHVVKEQDLESHFNVIDSCGTGAYHIGENPDSRSSATCLENGVPVNHKARQVCKADYSKFDYIIGMDEANIETLLRRQPSGTKAKVVLFGDFCEDSSFSRIVEDPYYGGVSGFQRNFEQVKHFSEVFLKKVVRDR
ncbi:LMWPc-domain-containing protein [Nadsonia fulvescens var. elongata DSM 6958]|uniref:LMWPc-domain-containing protein n=1 Tax=Nadsonia fulvescens var. elongata DSM 6958 TaxID=857566 RepID=A0A1E3PSC8_9ASCO|nr:LMWPc-domain-containing protein [Nadsonia fulvescens var. elongata DSM 6958]